MSSASATFIFDELAHLYRDAEGRVVPSVTQALKATGWINFDHIHPTVLERKRQLGTLVHKAAELLDKGYIGDYEIPDEVWDYLAGYTHFLQDTGFEASLIEERQLGELHGMVYGMQPDRMGELNGELHMLELKCGAASHPAWGVQLAGYCAGKLGRNTKVKRAALQLGPQFPRGYKLYPYDDPQDYVFWQCSLALTVGFQNKGILQLENVPERLIAA